MRWPFNNFNPTPFSDLHSLNLDWILREMVRLRTEWEGIKEAWDQMKIDWQTFQANMQRLWKEYKDLMNTAYNQLRQEWVDYRDGLDDWKAQVDQSIADFEDAWETYKSGVNGSLTSMQTQIDNFISDMESYITTNMPAIVSPIVREWLQEHGITVSAFIRPEDEGGLVQALAKAATEHTPILLTPGEDYYFGVNQVSIPAGTIIIGYGARIVDTASVQISIGNQVHIYGLDFHQMGASSSIVIAGSQVRLEEVSIASSIAFTIGVSATTEHVNEITLDQVSYTGSINVMNCSNLRDLNLTTAHSYNQSGSNSIYTSVLTQVQ